MIINDAKTEKQSLAELVASNAVKIKLKQEYLKQSAQEYLKSVHYLMIKSNSAAEMQALMMQKEMISSVTIFLEAVLNEDKKAARIFLCSYLIHKFPEALQLAGKDEVEQTLGEAGEALQKSLNNFLKFPTNGGEVRGFFKVYCQIFESWRSKDLPVLEEALVEQYMEQEEILRAASDTPAAMREWLPHVRKHQEQIRKKLCQVGGQKALDKLEAKLLESEKKNAKKENNVEEEKEKITVEHVVIEKKLPKENVKIVHELYWDPKYINKVASSMEIGPKSTLDFDYILSLSVNEKIELVMMIRESLIALCPAKEEAGIKESLDANHVREQIEGGCFEWPKFLEYLLSMMGQYCSPERDMEIERLMKAPDCQEIIQLIFVMKEDLTRANLMILKNQLEADPSTVLSYERQWFESNFKIEEYLETELFLQSKYKLFKEKGEKYPMNESLSFLNFALAHLVIYPNTDGLVPETMVLDLERLAEWQTLIREIIRGSAKTLINKGQGEANDDDKVDTHASPVQRLLEKRLFEHIVKSLSTTGSSNNGDIAKLGFKTQEDELKAIIASVLAFVPFHRQVHSETYSKLIAKIRQ